MAVSVLLYGHIIWTLTKRLEKKLWGATQKMQRTILNKFWKQHPTKQRLYCHLPPISQTIKVRRTRHFEYCWCSKDELGSDFLLWTPTQRHTCAGRPTNTYISSVRTFSAVKRTYQVWSTIGTDREKKTLRYLHDLIIYIYIYIYIYITMNKRNHLPVVKKTDQYQKMD